MFTQIPEMLRLEAAVSEELCYSVCLFGLCHEGADSVVKSVL